MRVVTVVGTRPEFIKSWPVSEALRSVGEEIVVHTGQHHDPEMSALFFEELGLNPPDIHLGVNALGPGLQLAQLVGALVPQLEDLRPDWTIVYGDTTTTLAGALAASFTDVPIAHVEAGLRSHAPMPEERNRVLVDHMSTVHFCPSDVSVANLAREGIAGPGVVEVGDVNLDALLAFRGLARRPASFSGDEGPFVLLTVHRKENADDPVRLRRILSGVAQASYPVVWPIHPRTAAALEAAGSTIPPNVSVISPTGFLDFIGLLADAHCIVTDSGGVQKEAYWLGVPCVTVRRETEWVETVEQGWNVLVGDEPELIAKAVCEPPRAASRPDLYGDGHSAMRIAARLAQGRDR